MYCNIFNFLEENSIIFKRQFGFRQKKLDQSCNYYADS